MLNFIQKYGLFINKKELKQNELFYIRQDLTVTDEQSNTSTLFYYEDDQNIYIPKLSYNMKNTTGNLVKNSNIIIDENIQRYTENEIVFNKYKMLIEPRNEIQKETMGFLLNSNADDKSLFLSPGTGKTAMSIMYFIKKKLKPLIILPDTNLINQWKESILEFTNLKEENIFVFKDGSNSMKKKDFNSDKLVYLCCIKTFGSIISKSNIEELKELHDIVKECKIDLKIFDECHLNLNAIFKTTLWVPTKENLFLSGTMNRRLVQENIIHPSIVEPDECIESTEYEVKPSLLSIWYDSKPTKKNVYYCQDMAVRSGLDYNRYFNSYLLSKRNEAKALVYFDMIENMCDYFINIDKRYNYDNKIIIVAYTIDFLDRLYDRLKDKYKVCRMYSKYKEKPETNDFHIIIGTNKMLTAGFDCKSLNIMISTFMNTSSHNIKQLIGRICRSYKNKPFAQYVCLIDSGFSMMHKYFKKHKEICETQLSTKERLQFFANTSKFDFPYIDEYNK